MLEQPTVYYDESDLHAAMFYTYILTNRPKGTLYFGHADDLPAIIAAHKAGKVDDLNPKHMACKMLVWFEAHPDLGSAFNRQTDMLTWNRSQVIKRIKLLNPKWADLSDTLTPDILADPARKFPSDNALPSV
ncbi:GIY-YIG nuclease family protein [Robiginitomaculum antarcticum]|uniref:hypothetical protein n=1 Tax=Robiginitomaculum antarcticum TaxID=437507 RepID=UPI00035F4AB8|nr:hypothetical protein [Robiginitomaculum antarcticum]